MDSREWNEIVQRVAAQVHDYARDAARRDGVPFYCEDDAGRWIKEYPDGRRAEIVDTEDGRREIPID